MKKIYTIILIGLSLIGLCFTGGVQAEASEETLRNSCEKIVDFIKTHLKEFKEEYNKLNEEPLKAVGIEGYSLVYIIDSKEYGVYLDFNGDNGYLVSSFTFNLHAIETKGDIEYLKDVDFTYYSVVDGFLYHDGTSYQKYIKETREAEKVYKYNGQGSTGEGDIYHLGDYIADRYPSYNQEEVHRKTIDVGNYINTDMMRTSYFIKKVSKDGGYTYNYTESEANCAITAAFNVMSSWRQMGYFPKLPLKTVTRDIREEIKQDPNYAAYGTGVGGVGIDSYWTTNREGKLEIMPELYYYARYYAVEAKKYTPESGLTTSQAKGIFTFITTQYVAGTIYADTSTNFSDVMELLQAGKAVFMGVSGSKTFGGDHAVALLGYYKYSYKSGVWIFAQTKTAYFYVIDDG
ncbi:MAG: hypothetical protein K2K48_02825, partial [Anaeroplasmataceae bacterium]|nr:hypothetical protein [Anaeroplasmataceae bacterium]MDE6414323.1 hypothetical protein [Anaeroplasmataceae bacterium]